MENENGEIKEFNSPTCLELDREIYESEEWSKQYLLINGQPYVRSIRNLIKDVVRKKGLEYQYSIYFQNIIDYRHWLSHYKGEKIVGFDNSLLQKICYFINLIYYNKPIPKDQVQPDTMTIKSPRVKISWTKEEGWK